MEKSIYWAWAIKNIVCVMCFVVLAIVFNKWWISLFGLCSMSSLHCEPTRYYRICDECGRKSDYADTPKEALEKAKKSGWIHYVATNTDYCPDCQYDNKI